MIKFAIGSGGGPFGKLLLAIVYIALVCPYDLRRPGGVRSHIAGLGAALAARGHRVEVIAPGAGAPLEALPVVPCGLARGVSFGGTRIDISWAAWSEARAVARRGYDVMHFHTIWNPAVPFQLAAAFGGPKVATFHDVAGPNTPAPARWCMTPASAIITRLWLRRVIAVSPVVSAYLSVPHVVIPNGVAPPESLKAGGARQGVIYVGRLEPRKGVATLLEAMSQVRDLRLPVVIAGDGELRAPLESRCRGLGLDNVSFRGAVSEAEKWSLMNGASILVAPSIGGESFGIVLLEAMASGAIPVASDIPGYRGVLRDRASDLLFPADNAAALAQRIRALSNDAARQDSLRTWGSEYWTSYRWGEIAARVERVYEDAAREI